MVSRFFPSPVTVDVSAWPAAVGRGFVAVVAVPFWLLGAVAGLLVVAVAVMGRGLVLGYRDVVSRWAS
jgi:hypothetical protein